MTWTTQQTQAMESLGGTVLVSAAAGSGKTAVLVERVLHRITDKNNPCDIHRLLMVTFTRAAAAQMREKIGAAITEKLAVDPANKRLARQQMLLPFAQISTIDSFCADLVRENFHRLDLNPDFRVLDESESVILREEAAAQALEAIFESDDPAIRDLPLLLSLNDDPAQFKDLILSLYDRSRAYAFPEEWFEQLLKPYEQTSSDDDVWQTILREHMRCALDYCVHCTKQVIDALDREPLLSEKYTPAFKSDVLMYENLIRSVEDSTWDEMREEIMAVQYEKLTGAPKNFSGPLKDDVKDIREQLKRLLKSFKEKLLCANEAENAEDLHSLLPSVRALIETVQNFGNIYEGIKKKANGVDFADIMHGALRLLVERDADGVCTKTALAIELSERFEEILVDEYQDVNRAQEELFIALSRNETNLFTVGDVKQSIYRFRLAMPELFLGRKSGMPLYSGSNYPARITLDKNFRSRQGILGFANMLFGRLMSEQVGDVAYGDEERLVYGADYTPASVPEVRLHLVKTDDDKDAEQADYIADIINDMIASGFTVKDKDKQRKVQYRDFCILFRAMKGKAEPYIEALANKNIPAYAELSAGFFRSREIAFMLSLLRVLDNPLQDVPLLCVMLSPVYGFSPDDLARLRKGAHKEPLYRCVVKAADEKDTQCAAFLQDVQRLRLAGTTLAAGELVRYLMEDTGYLAVAGAMKDGPRRLANLHLLLDYAGKYEEAGHIGLPGFIRFIDKLEGQQGDLAPAAELSEAADVVRLMSIHKSKGLEFPVVILANCEKKFNDSDSQKTIVVCDNLIGLQRRDIPTFRKFSTLGEKAVKLKMKQSDRSEELRVLYVALTRAKECLIPVIGAKELEKAIPSQAAALFDKSPPHPFAVSSCHSFADWLLLGTLYHPDAGDLRRLAGKGIAANADYGFPLEVVIRDDAQPLIEQSVVPVAVKPPEVRLREVEERLSYRYPYEALTGIVAKRSASELGERGIQRDYFASTRPAFLSEGGLTPAQKGTALHKYMQFCDYANAKADAGVECQRLIAEGFLSDLEGKAIDLHKVKRFFEGEFAARMFRAKTLMREKKFAVRIPVRDLHKNLPESVGEETVIVQGIVDCAFEEDGGLVVIDYKTDRGVSPEVLTQRYAAQLTIYRRALEECLGIAVKETLIYSFEHEKTIAVEG